MYLIVCESSKRALVVDPVDAEACIAAATSKGATIEYVLTTHHHFDHAGGNARMKELIPAVEVVAGDASSQGMTRHVVDAEKLTVGSLCVTCVHTPSHTSGHMSYLVEAPDQVGAVFTGDALFVGGCGRFFEGGPEQMLAGAKKLAALDASTQVYCGHEYTVKNLQFALTVEPDSQAAQRKIVWAQDERAAGRFTVPSTIGDEGTFNPFMRCHEKTVQQYVNATDEVEVMRKLRNAKDNFAGSSRPWSAPTPRMHPL